MTTSSLRGGDILIEWDVSAGAGDWSIVSGSVATAQTGYDTLKNAVLLSLFTDRLAPKEYTGGDRRGWWADTYLDAPVGSLLWTLFRQKITNRRTLLIKARQYCEDALQWMVTDGAAKSVSASCQWATDSLLGISIAITKPDGTTSNYAWLWKG